MKKTRFIPYGYTIKNGHTVIDHREADVIRGIFEEYITGSSLKSIAEDLTQRQIPYTEKTDVWDKARISRIIDNAKYLGLGEYDPIIDEDTFRRAAECKTARQKNKVEKECEAINVLRDRVRCEACGSPMVRRVCSKRQIRESWLCTNESCKCRVRISDSDLVFRVTLLMNRIIENSELMIPKRRKRCKDSPAVERLQSQVDAELEKDSPNEDLIISGLLDIADQLYKETQAKAMITAQIARKRALMMHPQQEFNEEYFTDLISYITLSDSGKVTLHTKTETEISEAE